MSDRPRFIAPAVGYTSDVTRAVDRLEAVTADEQEHQTEQAFRKALDERMRRREATSSEIEHELRWTESRVRYLNRELKRLRRPAT